MMAVAGKPCPDCGKPMIRDGAGIWKCPYGHGEWLRNEVEERETPRALPEKRFQPLTEGLCMMSWRTAEKQVLQGGAIIFSGGSSKSRKRKKKKIYKPLVTERYILA